MRSKRFSSIGNDLTEDVMNGITYRTDKRLIDSIAIHCSFSPQGRGDDAHSIDKWHIDRGWTGIGYHYVILEDGTIQKGRWVDSVGAHVRGNNSHSIGICRIGGMASDGTAILDATHEQIHSIRKLSHLLLKLYGLNIKDIKGHNEYQGVNKSCPLLNMNLIRNIV
jgi:N-acetylmuramoyl-L-alanine amidase